MRIQVNSAVFSLLCLGMLLSGGPSHVKADGLLYASAASPATTCVACVSSSSAFDQVINRTHLVVTQGNEGSTTAASTYSAGDQVTLKEWESGATTLDGSGNTNMQVDVTGGPIVYHLDPAYGDPIVAVDVRKVTGILADILSGLLLGL